MNLHMTLQGFGYKLCIYTSECWSASDRGFRTGDHGLLEIVASLHKLMESEAVKGLD